MSEIKNYMKTEKKTNVDDLMKNINKDADIINEKYHF